MKTKLNFSQLTKQFDYVNSDIEANFPLTEPRSSEYRLFHFDRYVTSEKAIEEIEKEGYSVATLSEFLLWKEWNGKDWVVALGSVAEVDGDRSVAALREARLEAQPRPLLVRRRVARQLPLPRGARL